MICSKPEWLSATFLFCVFVWTGEPWVNVSPCGTHTPLTLHLASENHVLFPNIMKVVSASSLCPLGDGALIPHPSRGPGLVLPAWNEGSRDSRDFWLSLFSEMLPSVFGIFLLLSWQNTNNNPPPMLRVCSAQRLHLPLLLTDAPQRHCWQALSVQQKVSVWSHAYGTALQHILHALLCENEHAKCQLRMVKYGYSIKRNFPQNWRDTGHSV